MIRTMIRPMVNSVIRGMKEGVSQLPVFNLNKVVMMGASITNQSSNINQVSMVQAYIKSKYNKDITIVNEAISGEDTADLEARCDSVFATYEGEEGTAIFMHIGGGDLGGGQFLDINPTTRDNLILDLESIYDKASARNIRLMQSALTFRNYNANTINNDPELQKLETLDTYNWTRDWIVPIMSEKRPEYLTDSWPMIDQYNMTRNYYREWLEFGTTDYVHPSKLGRLLYLSNAVESMVKMSLGIVPEAITPRDFNIENSTSSIPTDYVFGFGRDTDIGATDDGINWTIRTRPTTVGTEAIIVENPKDVNGIISNNIKLYSYTDRTMRQGDGNLSNPSDSSASLSNNVMLTTGLAVELSGAVMCFIIEGLEANKLYELSYCAGFNTGTDWTSEYASTNGDNTPVVINAGATPPETNVNAEIVTTNDLGYIYFSIDATSVFDTAGISGIRLKNAL